MARRRRRRVAARRTIGQRQVDSAAHPGRADRGPRVGSVTVNGTDIGALAESARDRWRGRTVGLVPQRLHLVGALDVRDNLRLAQTLAGLPVDDARITALLEAVGVIDLARRFPSQLSQGQAQRVAIARAVVNRPALLLADEPTANLDDAHAAQALELLRGQAIEAGATLVVASHDARVTAAAARTFTCRAAQRGARAEAIEPSFVLRASPMRAGVRCRRCWWWCCWRWASATVALTLLVAHELEDTTDARCRGHRPGRRRQGQSIADRAGRRVSRGCSAGQHPAVRGRGVAQESAGRTSDSAGAGRQLPGLSHRRHRARIGRALHGALAQGELWSLPLDAVLGSDVARATGFASATVRRARTAWRKAAANTPTRATR